MMPQNADSLLTLAIGAGWSEKKLRSALDEISREDSHALFKKYRMLRRALVEAQRKGRTQDADKLDIAVTRALKLLQSAGPYSETEILDALNEEAAKFNLVIPSLRKGGLRVWLTAFGTAVGNDRMKEVVSRVRNDFVHNPRPGWSVRDVK